MTDPAHAMGATWAEQWLASAPEDPLNPLVESI